MAPPVSDYGASTSSRRLERPKPPSIGSSKSGGSKGKGRAIDDDDLDRQVGQDGDGEDGSADLQAIKGMSFSIRFTDGTTDDLVDIYVNNGEAIRDVKRRVRVGGQAELRRLHQDDTNLCHWTFRYAYCDRACQQIVCGSYT